MSALSPTAASPAATTTNTMSKARLRQNATSVKPRVVVAGQVPPPICGQNLNIARVLHLLQDSGAFEVEHWSFRFTPSWSQVRQAGLKKAIELVRVWFRMFRLRASGKIDVVLYPVGGPHLAPALRDIALLPLALICSKKVVLHFRAAGLAEALPQFPAPVSFLLKKLYAKCGHAVVLAEFGTRDPESAGISNISVIHNASEDRYVPEWKKERLPDEPITILNVGLLCPDKGTPQLIEAFAKIHRAHPQTRLKLVGEPMAGLSREDILKKAAALGIEDGALNLPGVLSGEELQRTFAEADVFVFSTIAPFESFGMVLIEAMMWAMPIVATDWRANSEVLREGFGGELATVDDELSGHLSAALERVIEKEDSWSTLGIKNRKNFLEHYRIDRMEARMIEFFSELTAPR